MAVRSLANGPQYLIRFDDICPTIAWHLWDSVEEVLEVYDVKPIMAVIPDNQDPNLRLGPAAPDFWCRVRRWQKRGWAIGLHGYQHRYTTERRGVVGLNRYSEFAGLPYDEQFRMLKAGLAIFQRENINADIWVAPAHTFDMTTLRALKALGISTISDGHNPWPYVDSDGIFWVPQQLGSFRSLPFGVWTICVHPGDRLYEDTNYLRECLETFRGYLVNVGTIQALYSCRRPSFFCQAVGRATRWTKLFKRTICA